MRRAPYLVAALAFLPAVTAVAAPVSCRIVVDDARDEMYVYDHDIPVDRPEVDIVSADLATSATHLTTVVRVRALPAGPTPGTGAFYVFMLWGKEAYVETAVLLHSDGTPEGSLRRTPQGGGSARVVETVGPASVVLDRRKGEVRATVPLSLVKPYLDVRKGQRIRVRLVRSSIVSPSVGAGGQNVSAGAHGADSAEDGPLTYRAGSRSCVRPGA